MPANLGLPCDFKIVDADIIVEGITTPLTIDEIGNGSCLDETFSQRPLVCSKARLFLSCFLRTPFKTPGNKACGLLLSKCLERELVTEESGSVPLPV